MIRKAKNGELIFESLANEAKSMSSPQEAGNFSSAQHRKILSKFILQDGLKFIDFLRYSKTTHVALDGLNWNRELSLQISLQILNDLDIKN